MVIAIFLMKEGSSTSRSIDSVTSLAEQDLHFLDVSRNTNPKKEFRPSGVASDKYSSQFDAVDVSHINLQNIAKSKVDSLSRSAHNTQHAQQRSSSLYVNSSSKQAQSVRSSVSPNLSSQNSQNLSPKTVSVAENPYYKKKTIKPINPPPIESKRKFIEKVSKKYEAKYIPKKVEKKQYISQSLQTYQPKKLDSRLELEEEPLHNLHHVQNSSTTSFNYDNVESQFDDSPNNYTVTTSSHSIEEKVLNDTSSKVFSQEDSSQNLKLDGDAFSIQKHVSQLASSTSVLQNTPQNKETVTENVFVLDDATSSSFIPHFTEISQKYSERTELKESAAKSSASSIQEVSSSKSPHSLFGFISQFSFKLPLLSKNNAGATSDVTQPSTPEFRSISQSPILHYVAQTNSLDAQSISQLQISNSQTKTSQSQESEKLNRSQLDDVYNRQINYLDNLKRNLDLEMRERRLHLLDKSRVLSAKESDLVTWETRLLSKEKELAQSTTSFHKLQELSEQLENKEITLHHLQTKLEESQTQLQKRESLLSQKESEVESLRRELRQLKEELEMEKEHFFHTVQSQDRKQLQEFFSDEFSKLKESYEQKLVAKHVHTYNPQRVSYDEFSEKSLAMQTHRGELQSQRTYESQIEDTLILAYEALAIGDIARAKQLYVHSVTLYGALKMAFGDVSLLHDEILQLYRDITQHQF
jgi:hypothetical protein